MSKFPNTGRHHGSAPPSPRVGKFPNPGRIHAVVHSPKPKGSRFPHDGGHSAPPAPPTAGKFPNVGRVHESAPAARKHPHVAVGSPIKVPVQLHLGKPRMTGAEHIDRLTAQRGITQHHILGGMKEVRGTRVRKGLPK